MILITTYINIYILRMDDSIINKEFTIITHKDFEEWFDIGKKVEIKKIMNNLCIKISNENEKETIESLSDDTISSDYPIDE